MSPVREAVATVAARGAEGSSARQVGFVAYCYPTLSLAQCHRNGGVLDEGIGREKQDKMKKRGGHCSWSSTHGV